jgi:hypothetical protein
MSGIVLSASVRQNLLSLQSTADLLATTQNRLATGKKVNTALDNPTNFFTAASLDNRSSDINNLLDGIGNGVQVLQAANTGISSLQKLVDSAKSVANQALQASVGYSQKSSVSTTAIAGATAADLRGTAGAASAGTLTAGAFTTVNVSGTGGPATAAADVTGTGFAAVDVSTGSVDFTLDVDGTSQAISIDAAAVAAYNTAATATLDDAALTAQDVADIINYQFNGATGTTAPVTVVGGELQISSAATGTGSNVTITGFASTANAGSVGLANAANTGAAATSADALSFTVTVDGGSASTVTLSAATVAAYNTANSTSLSAAALSANDVASIINYQVGSTVASVAAGALVFTSGTTGTSSSVATSAVTGTATAGSTGITAATDAGAAGASPLNGLTLSIGATGNGTATTITFGDGTGGTVKSLNDLNAALSSNNLQASINSAGVITISTTNDAASSTIGAITGTAAGAGAAFNGLTGSTPVQDPAALQIRSNLVAQYNNILDQITSTSQDASYNGVNLLNGDQLKLTFNETGTSTLKIQGVSFNAIGLGLSKLASGTDFLDNSSATAALKTLDAASSTLRSQASALGSNLSIVQIRQDFSKNLINVLQTGSSNLTLADTNEEAANSQALSTRQSIAVSALALANQSQQSVLQLLR